MPVKGVGPFVLDRVDALWAVPSLLRGTESAADTLVQTTRNAAARDSVVYKCLWGKNYYPGFSVRRSAHHHAVIGNDPLWLTIS